MRRDFKPNPKPEADLGRTNVDGGGSETYILTTAATWTDSATAESLSRPAVGATLRTDIGTVADNTWGEMIDTPDSTHQRSG